MNRCREYWIVSSSSVKRRRSEDRCSVHAVSGESGEMVLSVWTEWVHSNDVVFDALRVYGQNLFIETTPFSRPLFSSCWVWIKTWSELE